MSKRSDGLRQKLDEIFRDHTISKIDSETFNQQKIEILEALLKLGPENLSKEEKQYLTSKVNGKASNLEAIDDEETIKNASTILNVIAK